MRRHFTVYPFSRHNTDTIVAVDALASKCLSSSLIIPKTVFLLQAMQFKEKNEKKKKKIGRWGHLDGQILDNIRTEAVVWRC